MRRYLLKRLFTTIPTFLGITLITFLLMHLVPGDPSSAGGDAAQVSRASRESYLRGMGLDDPLPTRYAHWLIRCATFEFGVSSYDHRPVVEKIAEALPITALVSGLALVLAYLFAVPLGIFTAVRDGRLGARLVNAGLFLLYAVPSFWVAVVLVLLLGGGRYLDLFPSQGLHSPDVEGAGFVVRMADLAWHLVLPVTCLAYVQLAWVSRHVRSGMLEVLGQPWIRTARSVGLPDRSVVWKHALRNAMIPLVTLLGTSLPALVGGSVVIEQIFGVPGMGRLGFQAVVTHDYDTLMAITTLTALVTMAGTLAADLAYACLDPRIRHS